LNKQKKMAAVAFAIATVMAPPAISQPGLN